MGQIYGYDGEKVVSAIFSLLVLSVILIGNGMVIAAFCGNLKLRNVPNKCFVKIEAIETPGGNRSLVKNITAQYVILSSIVETNKNEPVDNGNNF